MRITDNQLTISATDFAAHFECAHKTVLELGVAHKELTRPPKSAIERLMLEERGRKHEAKVLEYYRNQGLRIVELGEGAGVEGTRAAMQEGTDVIYQAVLSGDGWTGRPDFLVRTEGLKEGAHLYEPVDAKLAREEKAKAILQLCVYAEMLAPLQGKWPENLWLALGTSPIAPTPFPSSNFQSYFEQAQGLVRAAATGAAAAQSYPEPCEHCDVCDWWKACEDRRRSDDHLSLVAGISRRQRVSLVDAGVEKLVQLATLPAAQSIAGIEDAPLARIRDQARLQHERRLTNAPGYELLVDGDQGTGLELLPEPRPGDLFLDLEGDAFVVEGGLEYLFGVLELGPPGDAFDTRKKPGSPNYLQFWATTLVEEKRAFEAVMDRIAEGLVEFPDLHIFHFGHRENDALKRLSCKHGTREAEVDHLLRRGLLIDLHQVLKQGLRASVESYTLKEMESFHGFERKTPLREAAQAMQGMGWWLESREASVEIGALQATLAHYNEEDCLSTWKLREWLEERRTELEKARGRALARPAVPETDTAGIDERTAETAELARRILAGGPADGSESAPRQLLAALLDWHWREAKAAWWEYYEARDTPPSEWLRSRFILDGLEYEGPVGTVKKSTIHRYRFPAQEHGIRKSSTPQLAGEGKQAVKIADLGPDYIDLKRGNKSAAEHPTALKPGSPISTKNQAERLQELGEYVADHGLLGPGPHAVARQLLLRQLPQCGQRPGAPLVDESRDIIPVVQELCLGLTASVLPIQGPPGSGKTHSAAEAILALVAAGKRVGVAANSHQVVLGVLKKVHAFAAKQRRSVRVQHVGEAEDHEQVAFPVSKVLNAGELDVIGGTMFHWSAKAQEGAVDVLFVDEAGQISLANALAVAHSGASMVLIGDPAQLDQPGRGVHPPGADASVLEHILGEARTMPAERGVFLPNTRRLHPQICAFTSRIFYEGRLQPLAGLENQRIESPATLGGSGLRYVPVTHRGNTNTSSEEVETISRLVASFLDGSASYVDPNGNKSRLGPKDILVVAPYNAQVVALRSQLPSEVVVGTVDKFQGAEAPIVIYSMTTSSGDEAPRGLEFLYSLNRLNVATSRGRALAILVASLALLDVRCKTPRQLQLVNALCAFVGMAGSWSPEA